jgi:hypothetical protein
MTSKARLGSFEELLSENNTEIKSIAWKLREIIFADYPKAIETVRLGGGAASYGLGPKKNSESHVYIMPKRDYVNLGFFHGTNLNDPAKLLEGTGQKMRHVKVRSPKDVENPVLRTLISKARAERKAALGLK